MFVIDMKKRKWYLNFGDRYYSFDEDNKLYLHNSGVVTDSSLVRYVVNDGYQITKVFDNIVKKTEVDFGGHVSTGVLGIQQLMRGLTQYGNVDLAYNIATNETYPSWGHMVKNGATTIWELWNGETADPAMNSGNHVMLLGDLLIWYYEDLAGIKCAPGSVAYKKLLMEPKFPQGLTHVKAAYKSAYGEIRSEWSKEGDIFSWDITIPGNTSALVRLPKELNLASPNQQGVRKVTENESMIEIELGSGTYHLSNSK